ncbi:MAG TPA: dienelactone hydrolase family protein [Actinomycetota bacterium]|nr:dienelactone hydrolase family protein [Actinomycetota bacterium]
MPEDAGDYLAEPAGQAAAGVLVVHDWYGLLPHVRAACDDLAAAGLVALAADLYAGRTATDPAQAEALAEGMDRPAARTRLDEAVRTLRDRSGGGPVGVLGWSLGGMYALVQATTGAIDAAAIYYAALDQEDAAKIHCPVLLHLAEVDEFDPPEFYDGFVTALRANGTEVTVHTWPGTEHSFANRDVALHAPDAAAKAWSTTTEFLRDRLTGATAG